MIDWNGRKREETERKEKEKREREERKREDIRHSGTSEACLSYSPSTLQFCSVRRLKVRWRREEERTHLENQSTGPEFGRTHTYIHVLFVAYSCREGWVRRRGVTAAAAVVFSPDNNKSNNGIRLDQREGRFCLDL